MPMQVIALRTLREFWTKHPEAESSVRTWYAVVSKAEWATTADVRATFRSADFVGDKRVIFNVGGNRYRIIARISFEYRRVLIKFVGTHADYDRINPETV